MSFINYLNNTKRQNQTLKTFTIVELLVVILVIAVLVALSIVGYTTISSKASIASLQSDLTNNSKKLKLYQAQYGSYPTQLDTNYCPSAPNIDTSGQYCLKLSSNNIINNYVGSINNYTLGISNSTNTSTCYQITNSTNPTSNCSAPSGSLAAEQLLNQAVWWIDASYSTNGQTISNLGTGGTVLNATNGSTTSTDTNDAQYLPYEGTPYVYLPGVAGNYLSVPDEAALQIVGDIDLRAKITMDDWTPTTSTIIMNRSYSYEFGVNTNGTLALSWSTDGLSFTNGTSSSTPLSISDGSTLWIRATLAVNNGSSKYEVKFYSSNDGASWSQLGSTVTGATTTSIFPISSQLSLGSRLSTTLPHPGKLYRAQVLNGINGSTVLDVDTSVLSSGSAASFTAKTGQTVTINRGTSGRKSVAVVASPVWLLGTDDYMQVADNDLLDFSPSDSFTVLTVTRDFATLADGSTIISKRDINNSTAGYDIGFHNTTAIWMDTTNQSNSRVAAQVGNLGYGLKTSAGIVDRVAQRQSVWVNGLSSQPAVDMTGWDFRNALSLRLGNSSGGSWPAHMELSSAAIFRRVLTASELTTIYNYYTNRVK